jgi:hypothetical protein
VPGSLSLVGRTDPTLLAQFGHDATQFLREYSRARFIKRADQFCVIPDLVLAALSAEPLPNIFTDLAVVRECAPSIVQFALEVSQRDGSFWLRRPPEGRARLFGRKLESNGTHKFGPNKLGPNDCKRGRRMYTVSGQESIMETLVYMEALEKTSVGEDIVPFTDLLAGLVEKGLAGEPLPAVPKASSSETAA